MNYPLEDFDAARQCLLAFACEIEGDDELRFKLQTIVCDMYGLAREALEVAHHRRIKEFA